MSCKQNIDVFTVWNKKIKYIELDVAKDKNFMRIQYEDGSEKEYRLIEIDSIDKKNPVYRKLEDR